MERLAGVLGVSRAALALRLHGFAATCGGYLAPPPASAAATDDAMVERLARRYARTAVLPWSTCLTRSVAMCRALRRRGLTAVVRLGAARKGSGLEAHAWVELDGRVVNDAATIATAFSPLIAPDRPRA